MRGRGRIGGSKPPLYVSVGGGGAALRRKRNFWLFLGAVIRVGRGAWRRAAARGDGNGLRCRCGEKSSGCKICVFGPPPPLS